MTPLDMLVFWASVALAPAYLCRLDAVRFGTHASPVVVFHLALFMGCLSAGYHGWTGRVDLSDVAALIAAGAWLVVSWPTWTQGAPAHALREQATELEWPGLSMARRDEDRS
jgi:hypothetical protein